MTLPAARLDRDRLARLMAAESSRFASRPSSVGGAPRGGPGLAARGRADALDGQVGRAVPAVRRRGVGCAFQLRRRPRLRGLLSRRHGRDGRPRARPDDGRRRAPDAARDHPHAPDRGCDMGRRGADPSIRGGCLAVRPLRERCEPVGAPARAADQRALEGRRPRPLLPRLGRRSDRDARARWFGRAGPRLGRATGRRGRDDPCRRVQRRRRAGGGTGGRRCRGRADRTRPDQRRDRAAGTRLPRRGPRCSPARPARS